MSRLNNTGLFVWQNFHRFDMLRVLRNKIFGVLYSTALRNVSEIGSDTYYYYYFANSLHLLVGLLDFWVGFIFEGTACLHSCSAFISNWE